MHVLAEFLDVDRLHRDFRRTAQQVVEADAEQSREALVDHFERGHAPAHDAHLVDEVVGASLAGRHGGLRAHGPRVDTVNEGVDLSLVEYFVVGHWFTATA